MSVLPPLSEARPDCCAALSSAIQCAPGAIEVFQRVALAFWRSADARAWAHAARTPGVGEPTRQLNYKSLGRASGVGSRTETRRLRTRKNLKRPLFRVSVTTKWKTRLSAEGLC